MLFAIRCQNNSTSDEDTVDAEELVLPDFPPFVASFRQYKKDLTVEAKQAIIKKGMEQCKSHEFFEIKFLSRTQA